MLYCENCNYSTVCKSNWAKHVKTLKHKKIPNNEKYKFMCSHCNKILSTKYTLKNHYAHCKMKKEKEPLKEEPKKDKFVTEETLEKKITEILNGKAPIVQNLEPISVAKIESMALDYLNINDLNNGVQGLIDFTLKYPLKNSLECLDKSRNKFKYIDEDGYIVTDYGGTKFTELIFKGISPTCSTLVDKEYSDIINVIEPILKNTGCTDDILELMKKGTILQDLKIQSIKIANGQDTELRKNYIKGITAKM